MQTRVFDLHGEYEQGLCAAAQEIARGGLVIFPTETVYGIGADAQNVQAVRQIFAVKGRPMDNPLIAHVCEMSQVYAAAELSPLAEKLLKAFWPGPFTAVLNSRGLLPAEVSAGLPTVALRMPGRSCGPGAHPPQRQADRRAQRKPIRQAQRDDCRRCRGRFRRPGSHHPGWRPGGGGAGIYRL